MNCGVFPVACELGRELAQHLQPLRQAEHRGLLRVAQNRHHQLFEHLAAPLNQIQVPIGRWIKRAGIDGDDLLQESSIFLTDDRQARVKEDSMRQG